MDLGQFSVSLTVKDIKTSIEFYEKLGFEIIEGGHLNKAFPDSETSKWRILQSGTTVIGLFQGMFDQNIMTFNPKDVRSVQRELQAKGIALVKEADLTTEGPESIVLIDPDGNQILMDQH